MSHSSQESLGLRCIFHKDFVNKWDKGGWGLEKGLFGTPQALV